MDVMDVTDVVDVMGCGWEKERKCEEMGANRGEVIPK